MVGRLIEQQDIRRRRQNARQRRAARFAARQLGGIFVAVQFQLLQEKTGSMRIVARRQPGADIGQCRLGAGEIRLLRKITNGRIRVHEPGAAIAINQAGRDLEQGGLAGAIAADKADALTRRNRKFRAFEQRGATKGQRDIAQLNERRGHWRAI